MSSIRVAVLWREVTGYVAAALEALAATAGTRVFVAHRRPAEINPFDTRLGGGIESYPLEDDPDGTALMRRLEAFAPDALLVGSWNERVYRQASRRFARRAVRLLAMDNPWLGTPRQWLGVLVAPAFIRPHYEGVFVAGERQAVFARKLGFREREILYGVYTADVDSIADAVASVAPAAPAFLFLGRLVEEKGVDVLAEAYALYHGQVADPWMLRVCGLGPWAERLARQSGVVVRGFVQPRELPYELGRARCLVLPSRFEPWGVVIHEAVAAGLPVICTPDCGASVTFVRDGYNGWLAEAGSVEHLARALVRCHGLNDAERSAMATASRSLARQHTPRRWARDLLARIAELR